MHMQLCTALRDVSRKYFKMEKMKVMDTEPLCRDFLPPPIGPTHPNPLPPLDHDSRNFDVNRRADIAAIDELGGDRAILIDCTTICPAADYITHYTPGSAANRATARKEQLYRRYFRLDGIPHRVIYFFAVETSGGLGKHAKNLCKLLAGMSRNEPACVELPRILQQMSVAFQRSRALAVHKVLASFPPPPVPVSRQ